MQQKSLIFSIFAFNHVVILKNTDSWKVQTPALETTGLQLLWIVVCLT